MTDNSALQINLADDWRRAFFEWLADFNAAKTRRAYQDAWREFLRWYDGHPGAVAPADVIAYRAHLESTPRRKTGRPYSASTINQHLAALASFYNAAVRAGLVAHNPVASVRRKPVSPYGKAVWLDGTAGHDRRLLAAIDTETEQGQRDLALFLLFLTSALRVSAVAGLHLRDMRKQGETLIIQYTGKGGAVAQKALEPTTAQAISAYLQRRVKRGEKLSGDSPLFVPTWRGRRAIANLKHTDARARTGQKPLSVGAINKLLRAYCDRIFGKGHGITPHALRHTAARNAALSGATLAEISHLLAHKNPAVTLVYLHATDRSGDRVSRTLGERYSDLDK